MNILYGESKKQVDVYSFNINKGGELNIVNPFQSGAVYIEFVNGEFSHVSFSNIVDNEMSPGLFSNRSYWRIMQAIGEKIEEISLRYG